MQKKYDFKIVEKDIFKSWIIKTPFQSTFKENINKKPFTIILPPPNITGKLHLGHAWNNILQDIIVRRKKMLGFDVLFIPGMDHAGIATQIKVKQRLKKEGLLNKNLSKETFLQYAFSWKNEYAENIRKQWQSLGLFLNYEYEKFTLEADVSKIVQDVFVLLYEQNLIYRDYKIINWDPETQTALSNVEVDYKEEDSFIYYLKYFFQDDPENFLPVATTRPETIFVDQALMVHPKDKRYQKFIGKKVLIPNTNTYIPIISDSYVKMDFGTGVVKVTPAHDINDFMIGKKHNFTIISCINKDGKMNQIALEYQNLHFLECRKQLISVLQKKQFLIKKEIYRCSVGYSSISGAMIDQRPSLQWFLKTQTLSQNVLLHNKINFYPPYYKKNFLNWLTNSQDWCLSRQLFWGHNIPAWYKGKDIKVQTQSPGSGWKSDPDVLDTWFSSSLWPLITLGFFEKNNLDFQKRYPTDVLVTGYDILTFWVSRMSMQSLHLTNKDPFKDVLLHGLIRDTKGQKMSKSKGNGIDPLLIIEKYGTDTLRWFLTTNSSPGIDLYYDEIKVISSWNFMNKIWNIARFIKLKFTFFEDDFNQNKLSLPEKAILTNFAKLLQQINFLSEKYEFNEIGNLLYKFIWEEFANWGLEFLKNSIETENTQKFIIYIFNNLLKLLHPFIPFLTDFIYLKLKQPYSIITTSLPQNTYNDVDALQDFQVLKKLIIFMRKFINEYSLSDQKISKLELELPTRKQKDLLPLINILKKFFQVDQLNLINKVDINTKTLLFVEQNFSLYVDKNIFADLTLQQKNKNLFYQKEMLLKEIKRSENILKNNNFLKKAPLEKILHEKRKYKNYLSKYHKLIEFFK